MRTVYIGLLKDGKEIRGLGYQRRSLEKMSWALGLMGSCLWVKNTKLIRFPVAQGDWGIVTELGIFAGKKYGRLIEIIPLDKAEVIKKGSGSVIKPGRLALDMLEDW